MDSSFHYGFQPFIKIFRIEFVFRELEVIFATNLDTLSALMDGGILMK